MKQRRLLRVILIVMLAMTASMAYAQKVLSPLAVSTDREGKLLCVAEATAARVAVIDPISGKVLRQIELPADPGGLVLSADGLRLYVTAGSNAGEVFVADPVKGTVLSRLAVGHTPLAPVLSPDGKFLYVCNRFNNDVSVIDLAAGREMGRIPAVREPVAAAITPDGRQLFVANLLPDGRSDGDSVAACVSVIDIVSRKPAARIELLNGATGVRGLCISPDGKFVYVVHTLGRYQLPTTQLERGWMNTNALSIIDVAGGRLLNTVLLDEVDLGAANPWGVACSADGRRLCIAHSGTHELSVIDRPGLHERLDRAQRGERINAITASAADVPNDLSFLRGLRQRVKLAGNGPRGIAVAGGQVYAAEYFSDSVATLELASPLPGTPCEIPLGVPSAPSPARRGEMLFNDASMCFQKWQSCASCHPDARVDGFNWDLLNDGVGTPKNAKSMLLAHATPPVMSLGVRDKAESAVRSGFKFILFTVPVEADAAAVDEYLKSLKPVVSPHRQRDGNLTASAQRGKAVYEKAACGSCHSGPYLTNLQSYDLGTGKGLDKDKPFDTPTLVEVWRTAPYLHDGRAPTLRDVLTSPHGDTRELNPNELADLAEFVLSQ